MGGFNGLGAMTQVLVGMTFGLCVVIPIGWYFGLQGIEKLMKKHPSPYLEVIWDQYTK